MQSFRSGLELVKRGELVTTHAKSEQMLLPKAEQLDVK